MLTDRWGPGARPRASAGEGSALGRPKTKLANLKRSRIALAVTAIPAFAPTALASGKGGGGGGKVDKIKVTKAYTNAAPTSAFHS